MTRSPLFPVDQDAYGDKYRDHLLEQYKLYVSTATSISDRRTAANNYLLTINSALVTLYGLSAAFVTRRALQSLVPIAGILVSIAWWLLIHNYRGLNSGKFQVIHELEAKLPAAPLRYEWDLLGRGSGPAYRPLTHIEQWIPVMFGLLHLSLIAYAVVG